MADHREAFGTGRRTAPAQRGGDVLALAGVLARNGAVVGESAAGQLQVEIQGKTHGVPPGWRERSGSADQAAEQPEAEQQPDDATEQTFLDQWAEAQIDEEQTQNHKGDAEQAAVPPQRPGKTIDERAAGAAEQVEQP